MASAPSDSSKPPAVDTEAALTEVEVEEVLPSSSDIATESLSK